MDIKSKIECEAKKKEIKIIDRGNGHFQIVGKLMVNYYPISKNKSAYVSGTVKAYKNVSIQQAIEMSMTAPTLNGSKDKRNGNSKAKRLALLKKGVVNCYWCKTKLTLESSTLEHIIPLGIGGLDNANNRTLSCKKCNHDRGSGIPELLTPLASRSD